MNRGFIMEKCTDQACENAVRILKALAHPARLKIIRKLMKEDCNVSSLESDSGLSQSGVSQHLRILRLSGIIDARRSGKEICYNVVDPSAKKIIEILISMK